jgi:glycosyltransferase involved in cell wall biosynthesis
MEVSVVIPTYNRPVRRTVEAFLAQDALIDIEIIVVDDGSSKPPELPAGVRLIRQENQGLAAARNRGFAEAQGKYVLFNDDDIVPDAGFLQAHLALHQQPLTAAVSHTYLPAHLGQAPFTAFWRQRAESGVRNKRPGDPLGKGGFWFASLSVERSLLPSEPFASFRHYGWEEHELGLRLWRQGLRPRLTGAKAAHEDLVTLDGMVKKVEQMGRSAWQFLGLQPSLEVALWTGANPVSMAYKRLTSSWPRAQALLENRSWEYTPKAFSNYQAILAAAYTKGLLEGKNA